MSPASPPFSTGFVYVATGGKYVAEAIRSATSLREHSPGHRICLVSDDPPPASLFDDVIRLRTPDYSFADKLRMIDAPYERAVFLDTDTFIVADIGDLFKLLDTHDLAAKPEVFPGWDYELPDLPRAFTEFTTGVIAFRRTAAVLEFFRDWERTYHELRRRSARFVPDQPSFRLALYRSAVRHCPLPTEYHLQAEMGGFAFWDVKVVHAHTDPECVARAVNRHLGPRAYSPVTGLLPATYSGLRRHFAAWVRLNAAYFRAAIRAAMRRRP